MKKLLIALTITFISISSSFSQVINNTDYSVDKYFSNINDVTVSVTPITDKVKSVVNSDGFDGFLVENWDGNYTIYIQENLSKYEVKNTIQHEIKHIKQFESGRLEQVNLFVFKFDGEAFDVRETDYYQRPWERDVIQ